MAKEPFYRYCCFGMAVQVLVKLQLWLCSLGSFQL